jgi:hypothetical protein
MADWRTVMTTPIVIETIRNGNQVANPRPAGQPASASSDRAW